MIIQPIDEIRQQQVRAATRDCIARAGNIYELPIETIPVSFDLKGRAAGMYRIQSRQRSIRYNPFIFAKYFNHNITTTVPHEVAHYVADILYGMHRIKPHGIEWREIMLSLGVQPDVTGHYDLEGIPVRRHRRFAYRCDCSTHRLGIVRHNRVQQGKAVYYCKLCSTAIKPDQHTTSSN